MIIDAIPFARMGSGASFAKRAMRLFVDFLERKLGFLAVYDARAVPFGRGDLLETFALAEVFRKAGIIEYYYPVELPPDEPRIKLWYASYGSTTNFAGGANVESDENALLAAVAEALERRIWTKERDYFVSPTKATVENIKKRGAYIAPERFAGFSDKQREEHPHLAIQPTSSFLWIRGESLVSGKPVYAPAQTVSGIRQPEEPLIRHHVTTGLATWPDKKIARYRGLLEVIERDAYMISWFNQLTLPRVALSDLHGKRPSLDRFVDSCERYRLKPHAIRLLTDAPVYAILGVLEDISGVAPRFSFGIKTGRDLATTVEGALLEAERGRLAVRKYQEAGGKELGPTTLMSQIGHAERAYYWAHPENAARIEWIISGKETGVKEESWDTDTEVQHLKRLVAWCRSMKYECAAFSLGTSKKNPTSWHVEIVVVPELQYTHLHDGLQSLGGTRLSSVPTLLGYKAREKPHTLTPHPFY